MMKETDEAKLVARLRQGDHSAFCAIYDLYADTLAFKFHKLLKIDAVVEELHQDAFMRLWNARLTLDADTNLKAYLFTIAKNLAIDFYRKAAKDKELKAQLLVQVQQSYDHIEPLLENKDTLAWIEELISKLPPQRQKVYRMIKIEGKTYEETAHYFGVSLSTIKDHMAKSSLFLKQQLSNDYAHITFGILAFFIFK